MFRIKAFWLDCTREATPNEGRPRERGWMMTVLTPRGARGGGGPLCLAAPLASGLDLMTIAGRGIVVDGECKVN